MALLQTLITVFVLARSSSAAYGGSGYEYTPYPHLDQHQAHLDHNSVQLCIDRAVDGADFYTSVGAGQAFNAAGHVAGGVAGAAHAAGLGVVGPAIGCAYRLNQGEHYRDVLPSCALESGIGAGTSALSYAATLPCSAMALPINMGVGTGMFVSGELSRNPGLSNHLRSCGSGHFDSLEFNNDIRSRSNWNVQNAVVMRRDLRDEFEHPEALKYAGGPHYRQAKSQSGHYALIVLGQKTRDGTQPFLGVMHLMHDGPRARFWDYPVRASASEKKEVMNTAMRWAFKKCMTSGSPNLHHDAYLKATNRGIPSQLGDLMQYGSLFREGHNCKTWAEEAAEALGVEGHRRWMEYEGLVEPQSGGCSIM